MERFWEIDFLRGIAIILMVISNFVTDLLFFGIYAPDASAGFIWTAFARTVVSMFILLAGISLTLSYSRVKHKRASEIRKKYLLRGAKIFGLGMVITAVTWVSIGQDFILFGILHMIGLSIILGHSLLSRPRASLLLGSLFILIGIYLQAFTFGFPWLVWLGLRPGGFYSVDYVPLLPWFGLFLVGMFLGSRLYPEGKRAFRLPGFHNRLPAFLQFLGRNSLKIYFLHQPILILALWISFPHSLFI